MEIRIWVATSRTERLRNRSRGSQRMQYWFQCLFKIGTIWLPLVTALSVLGLYASPEKTVMSFT